MNNEVILEKQLEELRQRHNQLDQKISATIKDQFAAMRLKRDKLRLKDQIAQLEQQLYPDIIA